MYAIDKTVSTEAGEIAYVEAGDADGSVALFVHGVIMNSRLWRDVIAGVSDVRRCIAVDLPAHGRTRVRPGYDLSLNSVADVLAQVCDGLGIDAVDLVGTDTGGAVSQVFAARHGDRLRTLTLTNCDCHDNLPPPDFKQAVDLAAAGQLAPVIAQMAAEPELARTPIGLGSGYERPEALTDETVREYLSPFADAALGRELERCIVSLTAEDLLAAEPVLRAMQTPTLVVWGTGDTFFEVSWASWLRDTIPGVEEVVELEDAKLFFPDERAADLVPILRRFWERHPA
jgi:pimeloyl-ACP methyl ester carboxylesterase